MFSQDQQQELRQQDEFSSLVWICTSTQSTTKAVVIDANQPGNILESFFVCSSHVFCITSVPGELMQWCGLREHQTDVPALCVICTCSDSGARETDYPAGEEVPPAAEGGAEGEGSSSAASSCSAEGGSVLGGITVVGCAAEGTAAVPQTADSAARDGEPGKTGRRQGCSPDSMTWTASLKEGCLCRIQTSRRGHWGHWDQRGSHWPQRDSEGGLHRARLHWSTGSSAGGRGSNRLFTEVVEPGRDW